MQHLPAFAFRTSRDISTQWENSLFRRRIAIALPSKIENSENTSHFDGESPSIFEMNTNFSHCDIVSPSKIAKILIDGESSPHFDGEITSEQSNVVGMGRRFAVEYRKISGISTAKRCRILTLKCDGDSPWSTEKKFVLRFDG